MKKLIMMLLALTMLLTACRSSSPAATAPETTRPGSTTQPAQPDDRSLEELIDAIYAEHPMELMLVSIPVDLTDEWAVKSYTGLDSIGDVQEAVASEPSMSSQAYSLVLVRLKAGADAQAVARQMRDGINQRKWVCVEADDLKISGKGNLLMLVMIDSVFAQDGATAQSLTKAFEAVCGKLDFTID